MRNKIEGLVLGGFYNTTEFKESLLKTYPNSILGIDNDVILENFGLEKINPDPDCVDAVLRDFRNGRAKVSILYTADPFLKNSLLKHFEMMGNQILSTAPMTILEVDEETLEPIGSTAFRGNIFRLPDPNLPELSKEILTSSSTLFRTLWEKSRLTSEEVTEVSYKEDIGLIIPYIRATIHKQFIK